MAELGLDQVADLTGRLVAIDSINPELVAGAAGEAALASFVAGWLIDAGLEVELVEPEPGRPSVVATLRGGGGGRSLMLNAHLDTVGVTGMADPFEPRVEGRRLHGRGAYDMKGSLAAIMLAARELGRQGAKALRRGGQPGRSLEERNRTQLYAIAKQRNIRGRSQMGKWDLIRAIRASR